MYGFCTLFIRKIIIYYFHYDAFKEIIKKIFFVTFFMENRVIYNFGCGY